LAQAVGIELKGFGEAVEEIRRLIATEDLGFIAAATSPWHAMGADAWVSRLRSHGERRKGVVLILPHLGRGTLIDQADLPLSRADGRIIFLAARQVLDRPGAGRVLEVGRMAALLVRLWLLGPRGRPRRHLPILRVASPYHPGAAVFTLAQISTWRLLRTRDVRFVILDEGLSTYASRESWNFARKMDRTDEGRIFATDWLDCLAYLLWTWAFRAVVRAYPVERRLLFWQDETTGTMTLDADVAADYRQAILTAVGEKVLLPRSSDRPAALILSQPWIEDGFLPGPQTMDLLKSVVRRLVAEGLDVYVKPHPREVPGKYDSISEVAAGRVRVLGEGQAAERILAQMRSDDIVIGGNSTALTTASLMFKLPTYSLGDAIARKDWSTERFRTLQRDFDALAGGWVRDFSEHFSMD